MGRPECFHTASGISCGVKLAAYIEIKNPSLLKSYWLSDKDYLNNIHMPCGATY